MKIASLFLFILLIGGNWVIYAQNASMRSYQQARAVLDKSVAAYGGLDNLRSMRSFTIRGVGETVQRNQSRRPLMAERTPLKIDIAVDLAANRFTQTTEGGYPGGFRYHSGVTITNAEGVSWDAIRKNFRPQTNVPAGAMRARLRFMPQFVIGNALDRSSRLRYIGQAEYDKRPHDVVTYANEDGQQFSLYIDQKTGLLSKFETLGVDPFTGDAVYENVFPGYRKDGVNQLPTGRNLVAAGELIEELRYEEVTVNAPIGEERFRAPEGFTAASTNAPPAPLMKLSETAYTITAGGYNVLFVAFKDHVFVMEAPGGDPVSRQAIDQIKKTFPGKPIRYVAVTHHHDDHAGGVRTYVAEGATIITAPGERSFFENVMKSRFTIQPDALSLNPQPLKIETVQNKKRVFTDGTQTVEIHDIGSGPHTDEMLVAYLPNEKIIFQGDLLNRPSNGDPATVNDTTIHFAKWLESSKLPVEKIAGVHGPPSTIEEFRKAVADFGKN